MFCIKKWYIININGNFLAKDSAFIYNIDKGGHIVKLKLQVQFNNKNVETTDVEKAVKEDVKSQGVKMNTIDTLEVYYKPEDSSIYYVATTKTGEVVGNKEPLFI